MSVRQVGSDASRPSRCGSSCSRRPLVLSRRIVATAEMMEDVQRGSAQVYNYMTELALSHSLVRTYEEHEADLTRASPHALLSVCA